MVIAMNFSIYLAAAFVVVQMNTSAGAQTDTLTPASAPAAPLVDVSGLVKQFTGTDAATKQRVTDAITAIRQGRIQFAQRLLAEVDAFTRLTPEQHDALVAVYDQLSVNTTPEPARTGPSVELGELVKQFTGTDAATRQRI